MRHYILVNRVPAQIGPDEGPLSKEDLLAWAQFLEEGNRRVALTKVPAGEVSTVFLGLDHRFGGDGPPLVFESMFFRDGPGIGSEDCERCSTWEQAEEQHRRMVAKCKRRKARKAKDENT